MSEEKKRLKKAKSKKIKWYLIGKNEWGGGENLDDGEASRRIGGGGEMRGEDFCGRV
jgi:hypothetical protein